MNAESLMTGADMGSPIKSTARPVRHLMENIGSSTPPPPTTTDFTRTPRFKSRYRHTAGKIKCFVFPAGGLGNIYSFHPKEPTFYAFKMHIAFIQIAPRDREACHSINPDIPSPCIFLISHCSIFQDPDRQLRVSKRLEVVASIDTIGKRL